MATTSLWAIKGRTDHVLDYAMNPEKTENPNWSKTDFQTLRDVMDYAMDDAKTEQQYFVTALNCNAACARDQMQMTKQQFQKQDGILVWHGYQSFAAGEVDAKTAHEIGIALAKELWPDFQVIVATHLNTKCFHNHFVLNSVSYLHGGKFNGCKESYGKMRAASDRLCKAHGLSIITEHRAYYPKHYAEWDAEQKGQPTWRGAIRADVDRAMQSSMTWSQFLRALCTQGYEIKTGVKHIAIRPQGKERFVRLRSLGEDYTEDAIRERILNRKSAEGQKQGNPYRGKPIRVYTDFRLSRVTWKGLRALYFFYLRKLRMAQNQSNARYDLRDDLRHLGKLDAQARFLFKHKIDTMEQLTAYRDGTETSIKQRCMERKELRNEKRRAETTHERAKMIDDRLQKITIELKALRRDVRLCGEIEQRSILLAEMREQRQEQEHHLIPDKEDGRCR